MPTDDGSSARASPTAPTQPAGVAPAGAVYDLPTRLGRYTLTHRLGVGGMAEVFLAQQDGPAGFQKQCVVKKILPHLACEPRFVTMFQREARVAAMLQHTNVVQTFELGEERSVYFIAMEYVDGPPLHQLARATWRAGKSLPMELVCCALADAALGLTAAHTLRDRDGKPMKLVHRDISPDNLIINREGITKILDFGVAKIDSGERTATGEIKGKLPFLSPEQVRGDPVDERVDLYALGVTGYWLLTGHRPFTGSTDLQLMQTILAENPRPTRELNAAVPPELDALILKLLAKNPADRPASAAVVADALSAITTSRRKIVAPFVESMLALATGTTHESSPHDTALPAAVPQSGTFRAACRQIVEHLGLAGELTAEVSTVERALSSPSSATAETGIVSGRDDTVVMPLSTTVTEEAPAAPVAPVTGAIVNSRPSGRPFGIGIVAVAAVGAVVAVIALRPGPPVTAPAPAPAPVAVAAVAPPPVPVDPTPLLVPPAEALPEAPAEPPAGADAETDPAAAARPRDTRSHAKRAREIGVKGPKHVQWLDARGHVLGTGSGRLKLAAADRKIIAVDKLRGVRTTFSVEGGDLDYAALPRGTLQLRANPYADVTLGGERLGSTPFPPLDVVAGTYTVKFKYQGREEVRTVEVGPGVTARASADFGE